MSESHRKLSRTDWFNNNSEPTIADIQLGAVLRIADGVELMARRHSELVSAKERAEADVVYLEKRNVALNRSLIASKGQITKLNKRIALLQSQSNHSSERPQ